MKSVLIPDDIYDSAAELAEHNRVSLDKLVASVLNHHIELAKLQERAARGSLDKFKRVLAKVKDVPAEAADQL